MAQFSKIAVKTFLSIANRLLKVKQSSTKVKEISDLGVKIFNHQRKATRGIDPGNYFPIWSNFQKNVQNHLAKLSMKGLIIIY